MVRAVIVAALMLLGAVDIKDTATVQVVNGRVFIRSSHQDRQNIVNALLRVCPLSVALSGGVSGRVSWHASYESCEDAWQDIGIIGVRSKKRGGVLMIEPETAARDLLVYDPSHQPGHVLSALVNKKLSASLQCQSLKQTGRVVCPDRGLALSLLHAFDQPSKQVEVRAWIWVADKLAMNRLGVSELPISDQGFSQLFGLAAMDHWLRRIQFMSQQGDISLLASPVIRVMNQESASVSAGDEVPYFKDDQKEVVVDFKKALLSLTIKPVLLSEEQGQYQLDITYDKPGLKKDGYRNIVRQQLKTHLALKHNDSVLLGGIEKHHVDHDKKCPYMVQHIPYLRNILCLNDEKDHKQSLYVLLTSRLIAPTSTSPPPITQSK